MLLAFFFSLGAQGFAGLESGHPEQALDLAPIKAHHRLPINNGDRGRPVAELQEILERSRVCANVLVHEGHALARKKLFLLVATPSPGLAVHNDLLCHDHLHHEGDAGRRCLPTPRTYRANARSIRFLISATWTPCLCSRCASSAMSTQMFHPDPCSSEKQSRLFWCPGFRSHPQ